jgi:hypothetical protein
MAAHASIPHHPDEDHARLHQFRNELHDCLTTRPDALFELIDGRASLEESRRRRKLTLVLRAGITPPWQQTVVLGSTPIANLALRAHRHHRPSGLPD